MENAVPLVCSYVYKNYPISKNSKDDIEDLISEGFQIITDKIKTYNPELSKFGRWVWEMLSIYLRTYYRNNYIKYSKTYIPLDLGNHNTDLDNYMYQNCDLDMENKNNEMDREIDIKILYEKVQELPDSKRYIVERALRGESYVEIAKKLNCTKQNVQFQLEGAIPILKKKLQLKF